MLFSEYSGLLGRESLNVSFKVGSANASVPSPMMSSASPCLPMMSFHSKPHSVGGQTNYSYYIYTIHTKLASATDESYNVQWLALLCVPAISCHTTNL